MRFPAWGGAGCYTLPFQRVQVRANRTPDMLCPPMRRRSWWPPPRPLQVALLAPAPAWPRADVYTNSRGIASGRQVWAFRTSSLPARDAPDLPSLGPAKRHGSNGPAMGACRLHQKLPSSSMPGRPLWAAGGNCGQNMLRDPPDRGIAVATFCPPSGGLNSRCLGHAPHAKLNLRRRHTYVRTERPEV